MRRAVGGTAVTPSSAKPESFSSVTRGTMRTSRRAAESTTMSTSRGEMSLTCTSSAFGSVMSPGSRCSRHTEPVSVSGTVLEMVRGMLRSFKISLPLPWTVTAMLGGAWRSARPGGGATDSRRAKVSVSGCCAATATYSITAKNTAASLSSQFRRKNCPTLPGIDEPPDDGLVHGPVPLRRADHLLDDHAVAVDHEALGDAGRLVGCLDRAGAVVQDREAQPQVPVELGHDVPPLVGHASRHDPEVRAPEAPGQALQGRHLDAARLAPRRPHVEQHDRAAEIRERRHPSRREIR